MKAYYVHVKHEDYGQFVHAKTPGKAKKKAAPYLDCYGSDFVAMRANRFPKLDNKPLTYDNMENAGVCFYYEGEKITRSEFENICRCSDCLG